MTRNFLADDFNRLERKINRLERRGQWGGAMRTARQPFDYALPMVASPGDDTSEILYVALDPGRWDVFGSATVTSIVGGGAHICTFNLRLVAELGFDNSLSGPEQLATNRDTHVTSSQAVFGGNWSTPHVFTTVVLDRPMYVTLNGVSTTTSPSCTVRVAQLFAKPG